jgi:hypothetical protein
LNRIRRLANHVRSLGQSAFGFSVGSIIDHFGHSWFGGPSKAKSPADWRAFAYLLIPEPGPVGEAGFPLGELGSAGLPDGFMGLAEFTEPAPAPVPLVVPVVALPAAEVPPVVLPPAEPAPACANARVLVKASAPASAIVENFIGRFLLFWEELSANGVLCS